MCGEPIGNEVTTDIDVTIPFATWYSAFILPLDATLIILIANVVMEIVSLLF